MNYKEALNLIGGLGRTSKMPWFSYSIPATACKTGSKLAEIPGTVCHNCYALKGFYNMPHVRAALAKRLDATYDTKFVRAFVVVLDSLFRKGTKGENRFRWHDSGDIQSVEHLTKINEICNKTPYLRHWLPTKEVAMVDEWIKKNGSFASNLTVRLSHPKVGLSFKAGHKLPFSTVDAKEKYLVQCPAPKQGNKCLTCDNCWNNNIKGVNYHEH